MCIKYYDYFSYKYGMQVSNRHNITANCNRTVTKLLTILGKNDKKKWEACFINSPYTRRGRGMESTAIFLRTRFKYGIPVCERERRVPLTLRTPGPRTRRRPALRPRRPIHNIALLRLHLIALLHSYVDAALSPVSNLNTWPISQLSNIWPMIVQKCWSNIYTLSTLKKYYKDSSLSFLISFANLNTRTQDHKNAQLHFFKGQVAVSMATAMCYCFLWSYVKRVNSRDELMLKYTITTSIADSESPLKNVNK